MDGGREGNEGQGVVTGEKGMRRGNSGRKMEMRRGWEERGDEM